MLSLLLTGARLLVDPWNVVSPAAILVGRPCGRILAVGDEAIRRAPLDVVREDFGAAVLAPSLIDCHVHLLFSGCGQAGETTIELSDGELLQRAISNVERASLAGVTTLVDQGGRGSVVLRARQACNGLASSLLVAGPPVTLPREHMWYFGGEARTLDQVESLVRELASQDVDLIKIVATGGGTAGSNEYGATFSTDVMRAAVHAARQAGLTVATHASSIEGIRRSVDAGCNMIHHCNFYREDGVREFNPAIAERLAVEKVAVDPTLWVTESLIIRLRELADQGNEQARVDLRRAEQRWAGKRTDVEGLIRAGVRLLAGSDAGWQYARFGETWREVVALSKFGLPKRESLAAATLYAAEALRIDHDLGSLRPGRFADLMVLGGDPTEDLDHLGEPLAVFHRGVRVSAGLGAATV